MQYNYKYKHSKTPEYRKTLDFGSLGSGSGKFWGDPLKIFWNEKGTVNGVHGILGLGQTKIRVLDSY